MLVAVIQLAGAAWFYWQWGIAYTWWLPDTSALVSALVALTYVGALSIPLGAGLPNLPLPLASALITLLVYSLLRRRPRRRRYPGLR